LVVVVGGSAGAIQGFSKVLASLPPSFPAAVLVAIHLSPEMPSHLAQVLDCAGPLDATNPTDGERIEAGRVYVAPRDAHLVVEDGIVRLDHGPRENGFRPAVDPLFRTAAAAYGKRLVGVILSGVLDDGTAGLMAVKAAGGTTIVQEPNGALFPDMPRSALENVEVDHRLPLQEIGPVLSRIANGDRPPKRPRSGKLSAGLRALEPAHGIADAERRLGERSVVSCPECGGALWEQESGNALRFVCHVGHAFGTDSLPLLHSESVEKALWRATRMLGESAELHRRLATRARTQGPSNLVDRFERKATEAAEHGRVLRELMEATVRERYASRKKRKPRG